MLELCSFVDLAVVCAAVVYCRETVDEKRQKFIWGPSQQEAFATLKQLLIKAPILSAPRKDVTSFWMLLPVDTEQATSCSKVRMENYALLPTRVGYLVRPIYSPA